MIIPIIIHHWIKYSPPTSNDVIWVWGRMELNTFIPSSPIWFTYSTLDESAYSINIKMLVFHDHSNYHSSIYSILILNIQWCNMSLRKNRTQYFHPFYSNTIALYCSWWICIIDKHQYVSVSWSFQLAFINKFNTHIQHPMM